MTDWTKIEQAERMGLITPGELWANLYGFSRYLIGSNGEVISLVKKPRKLKPIRLGNYLGVQISDDSNVLRKKYVHRLVCELVYGPPPEGTECCHRDGDRFNNDFTNLRWGTHSSNEMEKVVRPVGSNNPMAKLDEAAVKEIKARLRVGDMQSDLARRYGVSFMAINRIANGISWRHVDED